MDNQDDDLLLNFFQQKENIKQILPFLTRTSLVSLRLLEYFCVKYKPLNYMVNDEPFDVHSAYNAQLHKYSKKKFDPFQRSTHISIIYNGKEYNTTIAQLCFFKWCLTYNVIDYVCQNKDENYQGLITTY